MLRSNDTAGTEHTYKLPTMTVLLHMGVCWLAHDGIAYCHALAKGALQRVGCWNLETAEDTARSTIFEHKLVNVMETIAWTP